MTSASKPAAKAPSRSGTASGSSDGRRKALIEQSLAGLEFQPDLVEPSVDAAPLLIDAPDAASATDLFALADQQLQEHRAFDSLATLKFGVLLFPGEPEAYDRLGRVLYGVGEREKCIAALRSALARDGARAETRHFLAGALWDVGDRDGAVTEWGNVPGLDPNHGPAHERLAIAKYYAHDIAGAWEHVHAAQSVDQKLPPQFIALLAREMAEP